MMVTVAKRNEWVEVLLTNFLQDLEKDIQPLHANQQLQEQWLQGIEDLFNTTAWGFRETLLVICVARLWNPKYKASEDFYECNPRSLYEKPIKTVLDAFSIPSRQSGPLNVAKSAMKIDEQWAAGRVPQAVAMRLVKLVLLIEELNQEDVEVFTRLLLARFLKEKQELQKLNLVVNPDSSIERLFTICTTLINDAPDQGNTPQRIIGYLLECYYSDLETSIVVFGHTDRASTTNTTSKKLGDITESLTDGTIKIVYEVSVKSFSLQRIREAGEAASKFLVNNAGKNAPKEIHVLCRRVDVPPHVAQISELYLGSYDIHDMKFYFIDIYEWVRVQLLRMNERARLMFFQKIQEYINNINTATTVKQTWNKLQDT